MKVILRFLKTLVYVSICIPMLFLFLFYAFVLRAKLQLGYFPTYSNPDPSELGFQMHYWLTSMAMIAALYSIFIVLVYCIVCLITRKNHLDIKKSMLIVFAFQVLLVFVTFVSKPFEWFMD